MKLSKHFHPDQPPTLADVCKRLSIEAGDAHTAMADATAAAKVLAAYLRLSSEKGQYGHLRCSYDAGGTRLATPQSSRTDVQRSQAAKRDVIYLRLGPHIR
ncbi:hypothetical protein SAMN04487913_109101 [Arthrobacter sp. ok362]|nr:hypothetical protein SAMN04487913_109101 [Arthrobacter sp. ok362]